MSDAEGGAAAGQDQSVASPAGSDRDTTDSEAARGAGGAGPDDGPDAETPDDGAKSDATDDDADEPGSDDPDGPDLGDLDAPVPPSALDASVEFGVTASGEGDFLVPLDPPAEAAHARRTMIGRSAEEVDHAPPRGRYAPERAPDTGGPGAALRWVAPAAALAIAGAVVVGRALRRRR
ncbi:hypothetical protein [Streptomyces sp. NP-1717]|uniref:hypothetical protein n=1 Tax=Streptomyces sp. NP-1717 TaxID=2704470 RepID=UPI001F5D8315|nr:hypothetical protein [Streptomyces sp. NP-1717]